MSKRMNIGGARFGRLVAQFVDEDRSTTNTTYWVCKCDCGALTSVKLSSLRSGVTVSCGCYQKDTARQTCVKRNTTHGMSDSRLYRVWWSMKRRCYDNNTSAYKDYGGRGIQVCDEWNNDFETFYNWCIENGYDILAERGECTIDRINVDGNYCPSNCRIVDTKTQNNNRRSNHLLTYDGVTKNISQWAEDVGLKPLTLLYRISKGWSTEAALTTPVGKNAKMKRQEEAGDDI